MIGWLELSSFKVKLKLDLNVWINTFSDISLRMLHEKQRIGEMLPELKVAILLW